jgi:hypothetical protein
MKHPHQTPCVERAYLGQNWSIESSPNDGFRPIWSHWSAGAGTIKRRYDSKHDDIQHNDTQQ